MQHPETYVVASSRTVCFRQCLLDAGLTVMRTHPPRNAHLLSLSHPWFGTFEPQALTYDWLPSRPGLRRRGAERCGFEGVHSGRGSLMVLCGGEPSTPNPWVSTGAIHRHVISTVLFIVGEVPGGAVTSEPCDHRSQEHLPLTHWL